MVDDHAVVRHGTTAWLASRPELRVVAEAESATEAIKKTLAVLPDVVLLDIDLGEEAGGLFAAQEITRACPTARIIAFTASKDPVHVRAVIAAGAKGYVLKTSDASMIFSAIQGVLTGRRFLDPGLSDVVVTEMELFPEVGRRSRRVLAPRETEVLTMLASGYTYREMAETMGIQVSSVNAHRKRIYDKLGLSSRAEAVRYAIAIGLKDAPHKRRPSSICDGNPTLSTLEQRSGKAV
ncbi:MAG TPA: response regulator transcription factor [Dongiaceae bacterium]|nr:response regulator transcription factor [Dongiaceae bacterium]